MTLNHKAAPSLLFLLFSFLFVHCDAKITVSDSCGDGMVDPGEQCDGADFGGATCGSQIGRAHV